MKPVWVVLVVCVLSATAVVLAAVWRMAEVGRGPPVTAVSRSAGLTVERILPLSVLTTLKVEVADARVTQLRGYTGSVKAVLVARGDITVGVDLSQARFDRVDEQARTAVLVLPQPTVQSVRLDHEQTKLIGVWPTGLWTVVPGGEDADAAAVNVAYRDAERSVSGAAAHGQLLLHSRAQAERVLRAFFTALGWDVRIRWGT